MLYSRDNKKCLQTFTDNFENFENFYPDNSQAYAVNSDTWKLSGWKLWQLSHSKTLKTFRLILFGCFSLTLCLLSYPQSYPHFHIKKLIFANIPYFAKSYPHFHILPFYIPFLSFLFLHLFACFFICHFKPFFCPLLAFCYLSW